MNLCGCIAFDSYRYFGTQRFAIVLLANLITRDDRKFNSMTKAIVWLILLSGLIVPSLLVFLQFAIASSVGPRFFVEKDLDRVLGGDPVIHSSFWYIEVAGCRLSVNPSIYPAIILLLGILLILLGAYLMLHVNVQPDLLDESTKISELDSNRL